MAFRTTRVARGCWPGEPAKPVRTPMRELATPYLSDVRSIEGELTDPLPAHAPSSGTERWGALVISLPNK